MANVEQSFLIVIDTIAIMTVIPHFVRQKLYNSQDGWRKTPLGMMIISSWLICLDDKIK